MSHYRGALRQVMDRRDGVTFERLLEEHRKGCHRTGVFKKCDAVRAVFLANRDLKRYQKMIERGEVR